MNLRSLGLTAIIAASIFLTNRDGTKTIQSANPPITIEELVKSSTLEADLGIDVDLKLNRLELPSLLLKQRLVEQKELTGDEFDKLKSLIEKPEDIEFLYQSRNITYPDNNSEDFKIALKLVYGAPLDTFNHNNPAVCDEFAIFNASMLYKMNNVEDVYILSFCDSNTKDEITDCHAISMYRTKEGWNFTSNTNIYQINLPLFDDCLAKAIEEIGYEQNSVKEINILKIQDYSNWVYSSNISREYIKFNMNYFKNPLIKTK